MFSIPKCKCKRSRQAMLMILAALVVSLTANGYADLGPTERLSGPALVGTLTLAQVQGGADVVVSFTGQCRGDDVHFVQTVGGFTVATTTATSLEGFRLPGAGPFGCLVKDAGGGQDLIVNTVVPPKFANNGTAITADVVLLYAVPL